MHCDLIIPMCLFSQQTGMGGMMIFETTGAGAILQLQS